MPFIGWIVEAAQRVVAFLDRRRGLLVVVSAAAILVAGATTAALRRPPVLVPAVDALTGGLLTILSQPAKASRIFTRGRGPADRIMALELELARLREARRENARLRGLLGYEAPPQYRTAAARVVGLDLDPLRGVAWISAGRRHGFAGGEAVMTERGLVGVVEEAGAFASRVRLLRNEETPVSVRDTRSRVLGILEWEPGRGRLVLNRVPLQADVAEGDTLISSGLGGVFPPGLPVGEVASVREPPERLLKEIGVRPFGTFHRLEEVFVLIPETGPPLDAILPPEERAAGAGGERR